MYGGSPLTGEDADDRVIILEQGHKLLRSRIQRARQQFYAGGFEAIELGLASRIAPAGISNERRRVDASFAKLRGDKAPKVPGATFPAEPYVVVSATVTAATACSNNLRTAPRDQ